MRANLTERFAKAATTDGRKSPIFYDEEVIGFGLQVRDIRRKTFTLDYTFEGRRRRYFIGDYPAWSLASARDEAKRLKREPTRELRMQLELRLQPSPSSDARFEE